MHRFSLYCICCLMASVGSGAAAAKDSLAGPLRAEVIRVIDGDTLDVRAHIWIGQHIETRVRLNQIDTPELRGKCPAEKKRAQEAKQALIGLTQTHYVVLKNIQYGKYAGRVLADVETLTGNNLSALLIEKGLAKPYDGGKRSNWCG
jgi:endonuclease YncB( thermonuclease family)